MFDLVDEGQSSNTPATILFDSAATGAVVSEAPALCSFVLVNAAQMYGSVRSVRVSRPGSLWVVSTLPNGTQASRLTGIAGEGVDCEVHYGSQAGTPGNIVFFAGRVPVAGERVSVFYRGQRRSVARLADAASIASEAVGSESGTSRWLGKVLQPPARTSADCESAAQAVLAMATSRTAAIAGRYVWVNPSADVWPGDLLQVTSANVTSSLLLRKVVIRDGSAVPELRSYEMNFANDWATEWADGFGRLIPTSSTRSSVIPRPSTRRGICCAETLTRSLGDRPRCWTSSA